MRTENADQQPQKISDIKFDNVEMEAIREVLKQMQKGAQWEVIVPPDKAFGAEIGSNVPPNVAVVFDIKLTDVK